MFNDLILVGVNSSGPRTCTFYFLTKHDMSKRRFPTKNHTFLHICKTTQMCMCNGLPVSYHCDNESFKMLS